MPNAKVIIIHLIVGLIKKDIVWNIALQNELVLKPGSWNNLTSWKAQVSKPKVVPADLSNLHNLVNNDVIKKSVFQKLVTKSMLSVGR